MKRLKHLIKRILKLDNANIIPETLLDTVYGHSLSRDSGKSIYKDGAPVPWYSYAAIEFLEQFDLSTKTVFEWGSGNSSLF